MILAICAVAIPSLGSRSGSQPLALSRRRDLAATVALCQWTDHAKMAVNDRSPAAIAAVAFPDRNGVDQQRADASAVAKAA